MKAVHALLVVFFLRRFLFALGAFAAAGTSVEILAAMVVIFFFGIYGAARPADYARVLLATVPSRRRMLTFRTLHAVRRNLTRWLLGRLVAMLFVGVTCAFAISVLKLPLAMTLALSAGFLTFVEYVGALISAIPPLVIALSQSTTSAALVLIIYTVLHVIEGYVLTPLLPRASVRFPPAALTGQVVFAALVGPLGLTFSTPLLIVVVSAVGALRRAPRARRSPRETPSHTEGHGETDHDEQRDGGDAHVVSS